MIFRRLNVLLTKYCYIDCTDNEKGDTTVFDRGIIRSIEKIYPDGEGDFVGIRLSKENINDYTPLLQFDRKLSKELTDLIISVLGEKENNKAFKIIPNYMYHKDIQYKIDMKIPMIKDVTKETNNQSMTLNLIGDAKTYDLIIAKKVGHHGETGAIFSVIKIIKNVQSPYLLKKNILEKGYYKVFFTEDINGNKRKSDDLSFSIY